MANARITPRLIRLAMGFVVPPVLMALCYTVLNTWSGGLTTGLAIGWLTLCSAFRFVSIQLIIYSLVMEFWLIPKLKNIYIVMFLSGLLLLSITFSAFLSFFGMSLDSLESDRLTPVLSVIIGSLLGYGLKRSYENQ